MGLEILMIDIKRLHELEKEVQDTHNQSLDKCGWYIISLVEMQSRIVVMF